jgi:hypothetical protein
MGGAPRKNQIGPHPAVFVLQRAPSAGDRDLLGERQPAVVARWSPPRHIRHHLPVRAAARHGQGEGTLAGPSVGTRDDQCPAHHWRAISVDVDRGRGATRHVNGA